MRTMAIRGVLIALAFAASATAASAQVFGTFTWQMQPYCNRVTLTLTSVTGNFTLDGSDDQCGAVKKASANGIGVFNPDGTVGLNFTIVTSTGQAVAIAASVSPSNGQGPWTDSLGNSGTFAFLANTPGLPARPVAAGGDTGSIRRTQYNVNVATTAASFATATDFTTITFTPPVTGTALVRARGYCNLSSQTAGQTNLVIGPALAGETSVNSFSDWVAMQLPTSAVAQNTQLAYIAERLIPVTAGTARTVTLKGYHEVTPTSGGNCRGSMTVEVFSGTLP